MSLDKSEIIGTLSNWMKQGVFKVSFVGETPELVNAFKIVKGARGYNTLENLLNKLMKGEEDGTVWEEIEHAFAVAKEASYFKRQGFQIEFEETLGEKDQKKPDFRVRINGKWVYIEIKVSSMFPGERIFLDKVLTVFETEIDRLQLPYRFLLLLKYKEEEITKKMPVLIAELRELSDNLLTTRRKDIRSAYPLLNNEAVLLLVRHPSRRNIEDLLERYMDLLDYINSEFMSRKLKRNRHYMLVIDADIPRKSGDIFATMENEAIFIGRLSIEKEKERIGRMLRDALQKNPPGSPYIVTIYSREVILKDITFDIIQDLFSQDRFREISGLILDVERAESTRKRSLHKRLFFGNPNSVERLDSAMMRVVKSTLSTVR